MASSDTMETWLARYSLTACADLIHHVAEDLDDVRRMKADDVTRMAAWLGMRSSMAKAKRLEEMFAEIKAAGQSQLVVVPQASRESQLVAAPQASQSQLVVAPQTARQLQLVAAPQASRESQLVAAPQTARQLVAVPQASRQSQLVAAPQASRRGDGRPLAREAAQVSPDGTALRIVSRRSAPGDREEMDSDQESDVMTRVSRNQDDATVIEPADELDNATSDEDAERSDVEWKRAAERMRRKNPGHPFRLVSLKSDSPTGGGMVIKCLVPGCTSMNESGYVYTGGGPPHMAKYWTMHIRSKLHVTCHKAMSDATTSRAPHSNQEPKRQRRE